MLPTASFAHVDAAVRAVGATGGGSRRRRRRTARPPTATPTPTTTRHDDARLDADARGSSADDIDATDDVDEPDAFVAQDYTDEAADRGLTTDDVADVAREEAGLPPASSTPQIGDRRPPAAPAD